MPDADDHGPDGPPQDGAAADWTGGGRSLRWRVGLLVGGALTAGFGVALWLHPAILIWLVSGAFVALGLLLVVSALCARGS